MSAIVKHGGEDRGEDGMCLFCNKTGDVFQEHDLTLDVLGAGE